ncbi:hypothetical protein [Nannocystis pusilla]|uniref:hypothetical protein n=1 Tax=Nannocystis pusilla TaxID=889268 RepID=UPI003B7D4EB3
MKYCLDTQDPPGSWQIEPDPRMFDTALVACALARAGAAAAAAVERARTWLERRAPQDHDPVARLLDEIPGSFCGEPRAHRSAGPHAVRRPLPAQDDPALRARPQPRRVLSPYTPAQIKELVERFYEKADTTRMKRWSHVDLLSTYSLLEALDGNGERAAEVAERLVSMQSADGGFCHNPVSSAVALLALAHALPGSPALERCLAHLLAAQRADGTFRFCTSDVWDTSLTLRAYNDHPVFARDAAPGPSTSS